MKKIGQFFKDMFDGFSHEFRIMFRDEGIILFLLFLPVVYPIVYSLIYNPELVRDVSMVVVDDDRTSVSREFVRQLDATQGTRIIGYAANLPEARRAVDTHKAYGIMQIPAGFGRKATDGEGATAAMYCEMSLLLRYRSFLVSATDVAQAMGAQIQQHDIASLMPAAQSLAPTDPLRIVPVFMGDPTSGFDSFIMPGVLILILQQAIILTVGMAGGARNESADRIGFNPLRRYPYALADMLGQMLAYVPLFLLAGIWLTHYVPMIFKFPAIGSAWQETLLLLPLIIASIGMGFMLRTIVWQREGIFVTWVATSIIFLFLSGLTWPTFAMPKFWHVCSELVPATWAAQAFVRMNGDGATLAQIAPDYRMLWALSAAYFVLGWAALRFLIYPQLKRRYIIDRADKTF